MFLLVDELMMVEDRSSWKLSDNIYVHVHSNCLSVYELFFKLLLNQGSQI